MAISICQAGLADVEEVAPLFDAYRRFYAQTSDVPAARDFLAARLSREESVLLLARDAGVAVGFTQLYPCFSSVRMKSIWILNDLYVSEHARRRGVARGLLREALRWANQSNAAYLELATATANKTAQALYEAEGWKREEGFQHFVQLCTD